MARGFLGRIVDAIAGAINRFAANPEQYTPEPPAPPVFQPDTPEQPVEPQPYDYGDYQEPEDQGWDGSIPGEGDQLFMTLAAEYGVLGDATGMNYLWQGWFNEEPMSPGERAEWRLAMADYIDRYYEGASLDENLYWFDWEAWRDYMGYEGKSG